MAIPNTAITRNEQYLAAMAGQSGTLPDAPITRKEHYLAKAAGQAVETPEPITREEMYLDAIAEGGGGGDITLTTLNVSANGTTNAPSGTAYNKVIAAVNPTLTTKTITANGSYAASSDNADGYSSVTVDVPGPDPSVQLVAEADFVAPVATSSNQTFKVDLDSTLVGLAPDVPFLALFEYTGQYPTAPEKITAVKVYQLFSLHLNYSWYIYPAGAWGAVIETNGTIAYSEASYSSERHAVNTLRVDSVRDTECSIFCNASNDTYGYQPGNWHLKLFVLQM